ncbi:MAG: DUF1624 domain-containing protein [Archangium sp.]|nr:DUF1624 domain-containing protein [Archangium sp.]
MKPQRIRAFDWLRGLAVVFMIQTHAVVLLKPELRAHTFARWLDRLDGLVAPAFLFSAGWSLAFVLCRAAAGGALDVAARATARRIAGVFAVASLINTIWFPIWREPKWLLRLDILHCVAISLALALPVVVAMARRPVILRWPALGMALLIFAVAPLVETTTGWLSVFTTTTPGALDPTTGSVFPLFPWAGYVFLGVSTGATLAAGREENTSWRWLGLLAGLGATLWFFDDVLRAAYPPHHFWVTNPANAAQRWTLVLGLVSVLRLVELRGAGESRFARHLAAFGAASLSAYFIHEMLLFQHSVGFFTRFWRNACDVPEWLALLTALIALTWAGVQLWERASAALTSAARQRAWSSARHSSARPSTESEQPPSRQTSPGTY